MTLTTVHLNTSSTGLAEAMPDTPKQRAAIAASDCFIIISAPDLTLDLLTNEPLTFQASGIGIVSPEPIGHIGLTLGGRVTGVVVGGQGRSWLQAVTSVEIWLYCHSEKIAYACQHEQHNGNINWE